MIFAVYQWFVSTLPTSYDHVFTLVEAQHLYERCGASVSDSPSPHVAAAQVTQSARVQRRSKSTRVCILIEKWYIRARAVCVAVSDRRIVGSSCCAPATSGAIPELLPTLSLARVVTRCLKTPPGKHDIIYYGIYAIHSAQ